MACRGEQETHKYKFPWYDIGDEQGFYGLPAVDFGVGGVPTNYLLDEDGLIVAMNIELEELEQQLETKLSTTSNSD